MQRATPDWQIKMAKREKEECETLAAKTIPEKKRITSAVIRLVNVIPILMFIIILSCLSGASPRCVGGAASATSVWVLFSCFVVIWMFDGLDGISFAALTKNPLRTNFLSIFPMALGESHLAFVGHQCHELPCRDLIRVAVPFGCARRSRHPDDREG